jgi:hypothetical protein
MIILFCDLTASDHLAVFEVKALPSADGMRKRVLREIDYEMGECWRRTHVCNMFVCQFAEGRIYMNSIVDGIWEARQRGGAFLRAYVNQKSPTELMADERRLALAMAFHSRLGDRSHLQDVDMHVLETIMWFAGPCLV